MSNTPSPPRRLSPLAFLGLVLVLVLGLAGLVVKRVLLPARDPSWVRVHADLAALTEALERYRAEQGAFPEDDSLQVLVPGYLPAVPMDPWGRPYIYLNNGKQPLLVTFGHDGERGGGGEEQDHNQYDGHAF